MNSNEKHSGVMEKHKSFLLNPNYIYSIAHANNHNTTVNRRLSNMNKMYFSLRKSAACLIMYVANLCDEVPEG